MVFQFFFLQVFHTPSLKCFTLNLIQNYYGTNNRRFYHPNYADEDGSLVVESVFVIVNFYSYFFILHRLLLHQAKHLKWAQHIAENWESSSRVYFWLTRGMASWNDDKHICLWWTHRAWVIWAVLRSVEEEFFVIFLATSSTLKIPYISKWLNDLPEFHGLLRASERQQNEFHSLLYFFLLAHNNVIVDFIIPCRSLPQRRKTRRW